MKTYKQLKEEIALNEVDWKAAAKKGADVAKSVAGKAGKTAAKAAVIGGAVGAGALAVSPELRRNVTDTASSLPGGKETGAAINRGKREFDNVHSILKSTAPGVR